MKSWVKAGLVGGFVLGIFTIISTLNYDLPNSPMIGLLLSCLNLCTFILIYPLIGVVAVLWYPDKHSPNEGAKLGALAGLIAGAFDSVVTLISAVAVLLTGGPENLLKNFQPGTISRYQETAYEFMISPIGVIASAMLGAIITMILAVSAGAVGGYIYSSIINKKKKEESDQTTP